MKTTPTSSEYRDAVLLHIDYGKYNITPHMEGRIADHLDDKLLDGVSVEDAVKQTTDWLERNLAKQKQLN